MRVMLPPTGNGVVELKPKVMGTEVRCAIRSLKEIDNETNVTCVKMPPDDTAVLDKVSAEVCMYTPTLPEVAPPIVKPDIVRETIAPADIVAPDVVKTKDVAVVVLQLKVKLDILTSLKPTVGVQNAKKADGYVSVIVPPGLSDVDGENPIVIGTPTLPAIRSDDDITKEAFFTCPKMLPDETGNDGTVSAELSRKTDPPDVAAPIAKPDIVIVTADEGNMGAPAVVMTTLVFVVELQNATKSLTLVLPAVTVGRTEGLKK